MRLPYQIGFRDPIFLLLCVLCAPLLLVLLGAGGRLRFSSLRLLPAAGRTLRARLAPLPPILLTLAALCLCVALAGPRVPDRSERVRKQGIAIMMVIDVSGSMVALDLSTPEHERTRLDAVREVLVDFVRGGPGLPGRPDDLIGIVSFAGYADTRCPLTLDHDNLVATARSLALVSRQEDDGTAIGDGLGLALTRLSESRARSKIAILLTDGVNNRGETMPAQAAELAKASGVKVYTVGAGTNGVAPVRVQLPFGQTALSRVPVEIDEAMLRQIADKTGGRYFRATDAAALVRVYQEIDALERTEIVEDRYQRHREFYPHLAGLALGLLCLGFLLSGTVLRRWP